MYLYHYYTSKNAMNLCCTNIAHIISSFYVVKIPHITSPCGCRNFASASCLQRAALQAIAECPGGSWRLSVGALRITNVKVIRFQYSHSTIYLKYASELVALCIRVPLLS